ncbi:hypothetical protein WH50_15740 [Pokkaliibacter plantistimulans]|uniref:Nudix hydrolase domain-containing protein n=1 Tax=Pokkaliibacter plantistimulans TaxID=1635171 RepID=A0ABX5LUS6_9GAMM|nr:CoA pyrophosphatase [Pokkaliibacter plantistimulans]PXF30384.1 hypothetical protein WH50_15740 [Pokkaliibacter plantistimulans]
MWKEVAYRLNRHQPRTLGHGRAQAGVLIALTRDEKVPHIILTRRASTLSTHGGEVAFPGGKRDPEDSSLEQTALREAYEEIGLEPSQVEVLGRSGQVISRWGLQVTPIVGLVPSKLQLSPNEGEIAAVFRVPVPFFLETPPSRIDAIDLRGLRSHIPCWHYEQYEIWGLTACMLAEFLNIAFGADFRLYEGARFPLR